jgi:hypothetical protein
MARVRNRSLSLPTEDVPALPGEKVLSIRSLKDLAIALFPEDHPLREVILAEKDVLTPVEFLAKMEVWTVLLNRRA